MYKISTTRTYLQKLGDVWITIVDIYSMNKVIYSLNKVILLLTHYAKSGNL